MGIPKFFNYIKFSFGNRISNSLPSDIVVNNLFIDANALLHDAAQRTVGYGEIYKDYVNTTFDSEEEMHIAIFESILSEIDKMLELIKPKDILYIAVDGPPPRAKVAQQRHRRFKGDFTKFDNRKISPGTKFMLELDEYIEKELFSRKGEWKKKGILPKKIFYDSHLIPGEGEHKIMDKIRDLNKSSDIDVIYGNDADLIILTMLRQKSSYVMRTNDNNNNKLAQIGLKPLFPESEFTGKYIYIDSGGILNDLRAKHGISHPLDFLIISLFIGNDFLPKMIDFEDPHPLQGREIGGRLFRAKNYNLSALNKIMTIYKNMKKNYNGPYLATESGIIWNNFIEFLKHIMNKELIFWFDRLENNNKDNPSIIIEDSATEIKERGRTKKIIDPRVIKFNQHKRMFTIADYEYTTDDIDKYNVEEVSQRWLEGAAWVIRYYSHGTDKVNQNWLYNFHYSPTIYDIYKKAVEIKNGVGFFEINSNAHNILNVPMLTPTQQLLSILPLNAIELLPEPAQKIMNSMKIFYPSEVYTDMENVKVNRNGEIIEYMNETLTPFYNISLMLKYYKTIENNEEIKKIDDTTVGKSRKKRRPTTI